MFRPCQPGTAAGRNGIAPIWQLADLELSIDAQRAAGAAKARIPAAWRMAMQW